MFFSRYIYVMADTHNIAGLFPNFRIYAIAIRFAEVANQTVMRFLSKPSIEKSLLSNLFHEYFIYQNNKPTKCEPLQFGSSRERIASAFAPYNAVVD